MSEENKTLLRRVVHEVWNNQNLDAIDELYASNYVGHTPNGVLQGRTGIRQHVTTYITAFPDCRIAIDDMVAEGDKVSARWTGTGTHRGELAGIAPTGKRVNVPGEMIVRVSDDKIVEEHNVWDTLLLAQQIGAVGQVGKAQRATT